MEEENFNYNIYSLSEVDIEKLFEDAYENNDAESQCALGYCFENGINVEMNKEKAYELYCMAASQGERNGIYNVGVCLGFAIGTGKERDALGWLSNIRKAAELGFAPAQNDLGWAYECAKDRGFFDVKDDKKAFEWYLKSALQDHETAIENVIRCYTEGIGTKADEKKAEYWKSHLHSHNL